MPPFTWRESLATGVKPMKSRTTEAKAKIIANGGVASDRTPRSTVAECRRQLLARCSQHPGCTRKRDIIPERSAHVWCRRPKKRGFEVRIRCCTEAVPRYLRYLRAKHCTRHLTNGGSHVVLSGRAPDFSGRGFCFLLMGSSWSQGHAGWKWQPWQQLKSSTAQVHVGLARGRNSNADTPRV